MRTDGRAVFGRIRVALASGDPDSASDLVARLYSSRIGRRVCADVLSLAAEEGAVEIIDLVLASGVPIDVANPDGFAALEVVTQRGLKESAAALLARGADPSRGGRKPGVSSAVMLAAFGGDEELVTLMIQHGADLRDVARLAEVSLLRIPGRVLRRIKQAGGQFPDAIEWLLEIQQALGDEVEHE